MSRRVVVIGGGASGLAAALAAAGCGAEVTVLERLPRVGKKILLTGSGRCNLGHTPLEAERYHGSFAHAFPILSAFDVQAFFAQLGLLTRTDAEGRMYPYSLTAASVLDALRLTAGARGAELRCGMQVTGLSRRGNRWTVCCGQDVFSADAVICAAGGAAAPSCGTDGSFYPILEQLGHRLVPAKPALCPVPVQSPVLRTLKGIRLRAEVSLMRNGKCMGSERGEVQFNEQTLSGICVFNLAREAEAGKTELVLNLLPEQQPDETQALLSQLLQMRTGLPAGDLLTGIVPKRVSEVLIRTAGGNPNAPAGTAAKHLHALTGLLHAWRFPVSGTAPFSQAQVTAGGVSGACITAGLESSVTPGLYFCGEIVDTDGDCGGYNLEWAWASGDLAGKHAAGEQG